MSTNTPAGPDPVSPSSPPVNRKAVLSVVYAVCAFAAIYLFPIGGIVLGAPAITTGIHARREIAASQGAQAGDTVAWCGVLIGSGAIVTVVLFLLT